jgi:hypothetical protein
MLETTTITIFLTEMYFLPEKRISSRTAIIFITHKNVKSKKKTNFKLNSELHLDWLIRIGNLCSIRLSVGIVPQIGVLF